MSSWLPAASRNSSSTRSVSSVMTACLPATARSRSWRGMTDSFGHTSTSHSASCAIAAGGSRRVTSTGAPFTACTVAGEHDLGPYPGHARFVTLGRVSTRGGVGDRAPRIDAEPKVTGAFRYGSDLHCDGMLWGATCRSPLPYARVTAVDTSPAAAIPGVVAVLTWRDVPGKNRIGLNVDDQPVLAEDVVRYAGEPIALVVAD